MMMFLVLRSNTVIQPRCTCALAARTGYIGQLKE